VLREVDGPIAIALSALDTLLTDQGNAYLDDDCTVERTVFVPTPDISIVDFDLDAAAAQGCTGPVARRPSSSWPAGTSPGTSSAADVVDAPLRRTR
jgi:hypothetical protein